MSWKAQTRLVSGNLKVNFVNLNNDEAALSYYAKIRIKGFFFFLNREGKTFKNVFWKKWWNATENLSTSSNLFSTQRICIRFCVVILIFFYKFLSLRRVNSGFFFWNILCYVTTYKKFIHLFQPFFSKWKKTKTALRISNRTIKLFVRLPHKNQSITLHTRKDRGQ